MLQPLPPSEPPRLPPAVRKGRAPDADRIANAIEAALAGARIPTSVRRTQAFRTAFAMHVVEEARTTHSPIEERGQYALRRRNVGHTFIKHGPQNLDELKVLAAAGGPQGIWHDRESAEAFLADKLPRIPQLPGTYRDFKLPRGLGATVLPNGELREVGWVRIVPDGRGGIHTAYPIPGPGGVPARAVTRLARELGLPVTTPDGQDWTLTSARPDLLDPGIERYQGSRKRDHSERSLLFTLVLDCLNAWLAKPGAVRDADRAADLRRYTGFVAREAPRHADLIRAWSRGPLVKVLDAILPGLRR